MNEVDSRKRCILCSKTNFNLTSIESDDKGRPVRYVNRPTIITNETKEEVAPLLPSFNRMVLNCQDSACSQCSLIFKVLVAVFGLEIFENKIGFDREALIQCCLTPPIGTVEQYVNILSDEVIKPSPRPLLAPEITIRPPHKRKNLVYPPFNEIVLLIEDTSLPLPDMQGSGRFINSDGVDLALMKKWWTQCQEMHGQDCQVSPGQKYPGKEVAGYFLRLFDVDQNRVVVAPPDISYLALSYVWPRTNNPFKAQEEHFQQFRIDAKELPIRDDETAYFDVPLDRLPKTIRDALHITRTIGEKYLWIDALCIIQDDLIDVQRTVNKMDEIYRAASLTIVMGDREGALLEGGRPNHHQYV